MGVGACMSDVGEETVRNSVMWEVANLAARMWTQHIRPMPFDRVFRCDGIRVRVIVEEYKSPDDTKPLRKE